ncbi:hypothetical protein ACFWHT_03355 [Microbacterium sp. NPDC058342]|uniref:hypothetical protein n=1 Tax=Microbacterium sp. NPDC058342 TaxID=3346454 RepID=UPI0036646054
MNVRSSPAALMIFDPKLARGGGQVVLEDLLSHLQSEPDIHLVMPADGQQQISIPKSVNRHGSLGDYVSTLAPGEPVVMVSNANSGMPSLVKTARSMRSQGHTVHTIAIVHNYPSDPVRAFATRKFLAEFDEAIVVEPGLTSLRADALTPSWLSLRTPLQTMADFPEGRITRTLRVKSYGRPDKEKGLDFLPQIFGPLSEAGYECEVALGNGFSLDKRYGDRLRRDLAPWLTDGSRNSTWIEPGDVFIIPSRTEAACLLTQEVLSRGAFAIASRVGLMTYLSPDNVGMRTFPRGDTTTAVKVAREALEMDADRFSFECLEGVQLIEHRAGRWHEDVVRTLLERRARF